MKIAILGMGPSWKLILEDQDKFDEIWTINYWYEMKGIDPDRVFDIHDLFYYKDSREEVEKHRYHWDEYLTKEKPFRFFAPLDYAEVPGIEVYPIWEVVKLLDFLKRKTEDGVEDVKLFTSSFDYLMGYAIYKEVDEVHLYGWSMGWSSKRNETEYQYQLPGLAFWTGYAGGRGIRVFIDRQAPIFKARMYTYEGASVITRQTLETFRAGFEIQMQQAQAKFHTVQGEFKQLNNLFKNNPDKYKKAHIKKQEQLNDALIGVIRAETAMNVTQHYLDHVDTAELNEKVESDLIKVVDGEIAEALFGGEDGEQRPSDGD